MSRRATLLLAMFVAAAAEAAITGTVITADGLPVAGATITLNRVESSI